ncbi:MAG TPA: crosslink repair DNA glycosylase YcaQ family protein, partial [Polyangiaceae bacterium]|nr:crosslink repair DNA glycosylase YcaQ family protein [Polyangiaceae bacterium]
MITLDDLRRFAVAYTLFPPTSLKRAIDRLGFVQADPIRAPARAQDLTLRHRVRDYRAGDLERRYARLGVEEDFFVNYGFVTRRLQTLMHPRPTATVPADGGRPWPASRRRRASLLLEFVRERGTVHPREADDHFAHGTVENYWGGSSNATTHMLDAMHYLGVLRVAQREGGVRLYAPREHGPGPTGTADRDARIDGLVDAVVGIYAPLPGSSLSFFVRRLRFAAPQWREHLTAALRRARERLSRAHVAGVD